MTYPSGKGNCYQQIINQIPPHDTYIEPFAGGGAVLLNKKPAQLNVAIDIDSEAIDQLRSNIAANSDGRPAYHLLNTDALAWLTTYQFTGNEFIYADPPYVLSTRRQHRPIYRHEMTNMQHTQLLDIALNLSCRIAISGYWSQLYADRLSGWRTIQFQIQTRGNTPATEYLWMNYPQPTALHDYSYLGEDYRERERIKRKTQRWTTRLKGMPLLERLAISSAIDEINDEISTTKE